MAGFYQKTRFWNSLLMSCAVYVAFIVSIGLWLSLGSRNVLWANAKMSVVLLALFVGSLLVKWEVGTRPQTLSACFLEAFSQVGVNPPRAQW
jgi:hypothetical protein